MESNLLIYDVGSTYTKVSAFTLQNGRLDYIGRAQASTTVEDIEQGLLAAERELATAGVIISPAAARYSTSSAAGGLRMVAMGFMPRVTAKAAKEVAMSSGARVLEIVSHEDPPEYRLQVLREIKPDIILLAGGTDGGDNESLQENAGIIVSSGTRGVVILAGNKEAQAKTEEILRKGGIQCLRVPNVMPTIHRLNVKPAREAIHEQFIRQITRARGLKKLLDIVSDNKVIPTPGAVLLAAELLACGTYNEEGIGDLLVIDLGGATTDIHSVLPSLEKLSAEEKGLVITNEKQPSYRTVEGNLGLRVSAAGIVETVGLQGVLSKVDLPLAEYEKQLADYAVYLEKYQGHISESPRDKKFDTALAISAVEVALKRHAGYISQEFDPVMGLVPGTPVGRDLRRVKYVIAAGGIFTHSSPEDSRDILLEAFKNPGISLLPENPVLLIDKFYLLYALGVLAQTQGDAAIKLAKKIFQL